MTSDPVAWLCPSAELTLAHSDSLRCHRKAFRESLPSWKKTPSAPLSLPPDLLRHCGTHTRPDALLLKMAWSIWMTLLNAPVPSVRCCLLPSAARWRTGQGHFSAWKDYKRVQAATRGLEVTAHQLSPEGCASYHGRTFANVRKCKSSCDCYIILRRCKTGHKNYLL